MLLFSVDWFRNLNLMKWGVLSLFVSGCVRVLIINDIGWWCNTYYSNTYYRGNLGEEYSKASFKTGQNYRS